MTTRVCSFTLKAGTVVSVGGVPVHLGHDTICVSHPDNRDLIEGTAPAPNVPDLDAAILRWNCRFCDCEHVITRRQRGLIGTPSSADMAWTPADSPALCEGRRHLADALDAAANDEVIG